jgi:quinolinate synthase
MTQDQKVEKIKQLKEQHNAIILTHNYQLAEVHEIADFVGDSLELSRKAADVDADVIVFCGVTFMAETAAILSPEKTVLLPSLEAGCPMADMATAEKLIEEKAKYNNPLVVTYVNSSADVKAVSDICVTSANALDIVKNLPEDREILFVPDMNLGNYIQSQTGRTMHMWEGFCPTHHRISVEDIERRKKEYPEAVIIVHPESTYDVIKQSDAALSTGGMCRFIKESYAKQFIVATEIGMIYRLQKENPTKQFIPISEQAVCPTMKLCRVDDVLNSLEQMEHKITVNEPIRSQALLPIQRMLKGHL